MTTPNNHAQTRAYTQFERNVQKQLDGFYTSEGYQILRRGTKTYDLLLDGAPIEEKIRSKERSDILIEVVQDIVTGSPGWFTTVEATRLHYVMCEYGTPVVIFILDWPSFKEWYISHYLPEHQQGRYVVSLEGWGATVNLVVPINAIPEYVMVKHELIISQPRLIT